MTLGHFFQGRHLPKIMTFPGRIMTLPGKIMTLPRQKMTLAWKIMTLFWPATEKSDLGARSFFSQAKVIGKGQSQHPYPPPPEFLIDVIPNVYQMIIS